MGTCWPMARTLAYGPTKNKEIGINKLYTTQGLVHIKEMPNYMWWKTDTGKLLHTSIEYTKIEAGIRGSLFLHDYNNYHHLYEDT